jgi:hypothetical protein
MRAATIIIAILQLRKLSLHLTQWLVRGHAKGNNGRSTFHLAAAHRAFQHGYWLWKAGSEGAPQRDGPKCPDVARAFQASQCHPSHPHPASTNSQSTASLSGRKWPVRAAVQRSPIGLAFHWLWEKWAGLRGAWGRGRRRLWWLSGAQWQDGEHRRCGDRGPALGQGAELLGVSGWGFGGS